MNLVSFLPSAPNVSFQQIAWEPEQLKNTSSTLYLALTENPSKQPEHIQQALQHGAVFVIAKALPNTSRLEKCFYLEHENFQEFLGRLSTSFYAQPAESLTLFGVTGTNGKTTTATFTHHLLSEKFSTGFIGTTGVRVGSQFWKTPWTTPESPVLQQTFRKMCDDGTTHIAMEVSSIGLDEQRLYSCRFEAAAFTNLSQDHLDYHSTMEDYYQSKKKLFTQFLKPQGTSVLFVDDPSGERLHQELRSSHRLLPVSHRSGRLPNGIHYRLLSENLQGSELLLTLPSEETIKLNVPFFGAHNFSNLALAVALTWTTTAFTPEEIAFRARTLSLPSGRLERIPIQRTPWVFVDYAHSPGALEHVLQVLKGLMSPQQRLSVVFGCGGDRDKGKRPLMGAVASRLADRIYLTADNSRSEKSETIMEDIERGLERKPSVFQKIVDRKEAIAQSVKDLSEGDVLIVAGKGHETTQTDQFGTRPFSDQDEIRNCFKM